MRRWRISTGPPLMPTSVGRVRTTLAYPLSESADVVLRMTKVIGRGPEGAERPTTAGLLALGRYPQQFFRQLDVTFVHYPTATGENTEAGVQFLDNVSLTGRSRRWSRRR